MFAALIDFGVRSIVAIAAGLIGLALVGAPQARVLPALLRRGAALVAFCVATFAVGHLHGSVGADDARAELAELKRELDEAEARQVVLTKQATERLERVQELEGIAEEYAQEIANGTTTACVSDGAYHRRLLRVLGDGSTE